MALRAASRLLGTKAAWGMLDRSVPLKRVVPRLCRDRTRGRLDDRVCALHSCVRPVGRAITVGDRRVLRHLMVERFMPVEWLCTWRICRTITTLFVGIGLWAVEARAETEGEQRFIADHRLRIQA